MKILSSWLNDITGFKLSAHEQAEHLEQAGIEIEQIISSIKLDKKIVAVKVNKVIQHPGADRLKLVDVSDGKQTHHIVCGAPNVAVGMTVPLAQIGTKLPDGTEIKAATIRGEASEGMLCSSRELGLGDDHSGLYELDPTVASGTTLCDIVDSGEILDVTTAYNRSDLASAMGIGRELAAFSGRELPKEQARAVKGKVDSDLVGSLDKNVVKRYLLARVKLGKTTPTPEWMRERLVASGVRPVSTVVDITNYVLIETGQPLHAFDAASVSLPISVRLPRRGEKKLMTLDGNERELAPGDALIVDARTPLALAGVMGGLSSEIIPETTEILLESATFDGATTRQTAVRHGLRTEASARFERNLPPHLAGVGLARALELLVELCGAELISVSKDTWIEPKPTVVTLSPERINALLGVKISPSESQKMLSRLGFDSTSGKDLAVTVPWWRPDVTQPADVIEEIARMHGYDKLSATLPAWAPAEVQFDNRQRKLWQLKAALRGLGLDEVATYSFVSHEQLSNFGHAHEQHLKLKNPLSLEQAYLRSTLAPSLVNVVARNARQVSDIAIFELSKVFEAGANLSELPHEPTHLGVAVYDKNAYTKAKSALDLVNREFKLGLVVRPKDFPLYAPGRSAEVTYNGKIIGTIGELSSSLLQKHKLRDALGYLEIDLEPWIEQPVQFAYTPVSRFPSITRDLSLELDRSVGWIDVQAEIKADNLQSIEFLNDYYGKELGKGKRSMAVRLVFGSNERTLKDDEADKATTKVIKHLEQKLGAKQRD